MQCWYGSPRKLVQSCSGFSCRAVTPSWGSRWPRSLRSPGSVSISGLQCVPANVRKSGCGGVPVLRQGCRAPLQLIRGQGSYLWGKCPPLTQGARRGSRGALHALWTKLSTDKPPRVYKTVQWGRGLVTVASGCLPLESHLSLCTGRHRGPGISPCRSPIFPSAGLNPLFPVPHLYLFIGLLPSLVKHILVASRGKLPGK